MSACSSGPSRSSSTPGTVPCRKQSVFSLSRYQRRGAGGGEEVLWKRTAAHKWNSNAASGDLHVRQRQPMARGRAPARPRWPCAAPHPSAPRARRAPRGSCRTRCRTTGVRWAALVLQMMCVCRSARGQQRPEPTWSSEHPQRGSPLLRPAIMTIDIAPGRHQVTSRPHMRSLSQVTSPARPVRNCR